MHDNEKLRGFANIVLDDCFMVRGLTILAGSQGLYVTMPARKRRDGSFQDVAHPINNDTRLMIEDAVLDEYQNAFDEEEANAQSKS